MKYIFILIIILLVSVLLFLLKNGKVEKFTINKENDNIETQIPDVYIPNSKDTLNNLNKDYDIINLYKNILNREPNANELKKAKKIPISDLKIQLLNSPEYDHMINMQTNNASDNIEGIISKKNLLEIISKIYNEELNENINTKLLLPLRDVYAHLQFNEYLFRAMIVNNNYRNFEEDILNSTMLSKEKLIILFNKYFDLKELKSDANDIIKYKKINKEYDNEKEPEPIDKKHYSSINEKSNEDIKPQLKKILEDNDNIFNKNDVAKILKDNKDSELIVRIYDPIDYKGEYRGKKEFRPPICNNLGVKNEAKPIFTESKLLFQGTDLDKAFEDTQVGSIMPKFEYKEYNDIRIKH